MNILFWICFISELGVVIWWILDDLKLTYSQPNPFSYMSFFYLMIVLFVRFGLHWKGVSNGMVFVPAIPLLGLLFIIIAATLSKTPWR